MQPDICHINLAPTFRGGERQTELLIRELSLAGWTQMAVIRRGGVLAKRLRRNPVRNLKIIEKPASIMIASLGLGNPGLIHVHQGRSLKVAYIMHLRKGTPYIVTRRVDKPIRQTRLNKAMYRNATEVAALTTAIERAVLKIDATRKCRIIPSASADLRRSETALQINRKKFPKKFLVGHIGALTEWHKGQNQIIAAAHKLKDSHPDIGFVLVGSGPDELKLKKSCEDLDSVFFTGEVRDVGNYLGTFDLFVFPSRQEGLGSSILDAYQFGLPVLASRVGGIPDIVKDGVNGVLFDVDDVDGIAAAVAKYHDDDELRERVSATNLQEVKKYSAPLMAAKYDAIYREILKGRSPKTTGAAQKQS